MLLLLMVVAGFVMIAGYVIQYLAYRKSVKADEVCRLMNLDAYLAEASENGYSSSDKPYSREVYFNEVTGLSETYHRKLSNTLHEHHNHGDLSQKIKKLKQNPNMDIDALFPGFMTEVRRVAHDLSLEIDNKLRKRAASDSPHASTKRRRRR
ncbi:MAG: hypothetical protein ABJN69_11580 [Hellea sp.]